MRGNGQVFPAEDPLTRLAMACGSSIPGGFADMGRRDLAGWPGRFIDMGGAGSIAEAVVEAALAKIEIARLAHDVNTASERARTTPRSRWLWQRRSWRGKVAAGQRRSCPSHRKRWAPSPWPASRRSSSSWCAR